MDSSTTGKQVRQKRVLPTRTRRGGPGVGNCDVDLMILDTQRRKPENEPLIPADTQFLLTTNSALASTSSSTFRVNVYANERYFERPEVLKAYREQSIIETPEFQNLGDTTVGRLRARSQAGITEDGPVETSDAVYEKRHRKFETWEKRARLREKEKLKHDQYKLKERIDQLRAMDASAFLALPDDLFPAPPALQEEVDINDEEGSFLAHFSGGPSSREGERRRKEMLRIAYSLEERFRLLLPPDRARKPGGQVPGEPLTEPEISGHISKLASPDIAPIIETVDPASKAKLKLVTRPLVQTPKNLKSTPRQKRKGSPSPPPKPVQPPDQQIPEAPITQHSLSTDGVDDSLLSPQSSHATLLPTVAPTTYHTRLGSPPSQRVYRCPHSPTPPPQARALSLAATPLSNPEIAFLQPEFCSDVEILHENDHESASARSISMSIEHRDLAFIPSQPAHRPHKRVKVSPAPAITSFSPPQITREPSIPPIVSLPVPLLRRRSPSHASTVQSSRRYGSYAGASESERHGMLMIQAIRSSESRASKGQRHWYAFGGKVHNELFEEREYEIPDWVGVLYPRSRPFRPPVHKTDADL
ncbi:hypothetical protein H0H92_002145 [Tricholoma furcatifolium]|nr:hypothetical protein H0H92_002145 [Tricholoma furcatifolium]